MKRKLNHLQKVALVFCSFPLAMVGVCIVVRNAERIDAFFEKVVKALLF